MGSVFFWRGGVAMLHRKLALALVLAGGLALAGSPARADWDPGDGHKMHWPQEPDPNGWDVAMCENEMADDWQCSETGWVTDIHFWGSWKGDVSKPFTKVELFIHSNIAQGPDGWSIPGPVLWQRTFTPGQWTQRGFTGDQGWFSPCPDVPPGPGQPILSDHVNYYQYNFDIPKDEALLQRKGEVYWLGVKLYWDFSDEYWGWKTSQSQHFLDDAVWYEWVTPAGQPGYYRWTEIRDPITGESVDFAFVITGVPAPLIPEPAGLSLIGLALLSLRKRRTRHG